MDKGTGDMEGWRERKRREMKAWHCCCENVQCLAKGEEEENVGILEVLPGLGTASVLWSQAV